MFEHCKRHRFFDDFISMMMMMVIKNVRKKKHKISVNPVNESTITMTIIISLWETKQKNNETNKSSFIYVVYNKKQSHIRSRTMSNDDEE